jgi:hypothetical protein
MGMVELNKEKQPKMEDEQRSLVLVVVGVQRSLISLN